MSGSLYQAPYVTDAPSVQHIMLQVLLALIPAIAVTGWVYGGGIFLSLLLATLSALICESLVLLLRKRPIMPALSDASAVITAWLLVLSMPPLVPWWLIVVGVAFAIIVAKQLYGGLGYNPFNPAMVGYAVLLISFPTFMTTWQAPLSLAHHTLSTMEQWQFILQGNFLQGGVGHIPLDAITSATPLDTIRTQLSLKHTVDEIMRAPIFGTLGGKNSEWITLAYLLGGLYLLRTRIISWQLPFAFLSTVMGIATLLHAINPMRFASPWLHTFAGGTILGAFFILTDPVSAPTTVRGKLYFAAGAGVITYVIRTWGGYPDGVAFAVLIMNMCVPLLDEHTQPRVFGHSK